MIATTYTPWTNEMATRTEGSGGSTTNLQNLTYSWDLAGNLHQRVDNRQGLTEPEVERHRRGGEGLALLLEAELLGEVEVEAR